MPPTFIPPRLWGVFCWSYTLVCWWYTGTWSTRDLNRHKFSLIYQEKTKSLLRRRAHWHRINAKISAFAWLPDVLDCEQWLWLGCKRPRCTFLFDLKRNSEFPISMEIFEGKLGDGAWSCWEERIFLLKYKGIKPKTSGTYQWSSIIWSGD